MLAAFFVAGIQSANAQVLSQNQLINKPFGGPGFIVSTTTGNSGKLEASSTPFFSNFFSNAGHIVNLLVTNSTTTNATTTGSIYFTALDCSGNLNGGALTIASDHKVVCSDDDSGGGGSAYPFTSNGTGVFWNQISVSSTTQFHFGATGISLSASSTAQFNTSSTTMADFALASTTNLTVSTVTSALGLFGSTGILGKYTGSSNPCTNQLPTTISVVGALGGCLSVSNAMLSNSTIGATSPNSTLTFGSAAALGATFTGDINLAHSNVWTVLQSFLGNASSTQQSDGKLYVGMTATTTINGVGDLFVAGSTTLQNFTGVNGTTTNATTTSFAITNAVSALLLTGSAGQVGKYGGASACSANNFVTTISAIGGTTCATAAISGVNLGSNLNAHTVSGSITGTSYNGSAAVSDWALNMANANSWTAKQTFVSASSTNFTASTYLEIPHTANPAPVANGSIALSNNVPYQLHVGNNAAGTTIFDPRVAFTFGIATSTIWAGTTTAPVIVIPEGLTWDTISCTIQPITATLNAQYQYANPTVFTTVLPTLIPASTTPGIWTWTTNNTPSTGATSTISFGTPANGPTSASCTLIGRVTSI